MYVCYLFHDQELENRVFDDNSPSTLLGKWTHKSLLLWLFFTMLFIYTVNKKDLKHTEVSGKIFY